MKGGNQTQVLPFVKGRQRGFYIPLTPNFLGVKKCLDPGFRRGDGLEEFFAKPSIMIGMKNINIRRRIRDED